MSQQSVAAAQTPLKNVRSPKSKTVVARHHCWTGFPWDLPRWGWRAACPGHCKDCWTWTRGPHCCSGYTAEPACECPVTSGRVGTGCAALSGHMWKGAGGGTCGMGTGGLQFLICIEKQNSSVLQSINMPYSKGM